MKRLCNLVVFTLFLGISQLHAQCEQYDLNSDDVLNTSDFLLFLPDFGNTCPPACQSDFIGDGWVNTSDFLLFIPCFGIAVTLPDSVIDIDGNVYQATVIGTLLILLLTKERILVQQAGMCPLLQTGQSWLITWEAKVIQVRN